MLLQKIGPPHQCRVRVRVMYFFLLNIRLSRESNEVFSSDSESLSICERLFSSLELSLGVLFKTKKDFY